MKFLFISDLYPPISKGGYEMRCKETVEAFNQRGHNSVVLTTKLNREKLGVEPNIYRLLHSNPLHTADTNKKSFDLIRLQRRYKQVKWAIQCRQNKIITENLANNVRPDIAFIWNMELLGVEPILAVQKHKIPTIYSIGEYWLLELKKELCQDPNPIKRRYRAMILGLSYFNQLDLSHMLVVSHAVKQLYVANSFVERDIRVIPRGIDSDLILNTNRLNNFKNNQKDKIRLVYVGRVVPEKAPDIAIQALGTLVQEMNQKNIYLDIIGSGTDQYILELRKIIAAHNLQDNVAFLGRMDHKELINRYCQYNALLFPARWEEPFSSSILEAMARGVPVIASKRGGALDIIRDGENGLLIPVDEPVILANTILRLIQNPDLAQNIRVNALQTVIDKYTQEQIVDQILDYMSEVLDSKFRNVLNSSQVQNKN
ncbi:MAG: glycosyltransferase family 4 protein [Anaerolineaceae bacterium]|nr:glycosyltransferase family 4 protein [Anaerolineaceae bacterium]